VSHGRKKHDNIYVNITIDTQTMRPFIVA